MHIIAEIGVNHNGSYNEACELIERSIEAGANEVKLQHFDSLDLFVRRNLSKIKPEFMLSAYKQRMKTVKALPLGVQQDLYAKYYENLFCTVFSPVSLWEALMIDKDYPRKIPSERRRDVELTNHFFAIDSDLTKYVSSTDYSLRSDGNVLYLYTVYDYPAAVKDYDFPVMMAALNNTGISDHTRGYEIPIRCAMEGIAVLEKHVTLSRSQKGADHKMSMNIREFRSMVKRVRDIECSL